jgi:hypothetical protein
MTVQTDLNRKQYAGNGVTTAFATSPVVFFDETDLDVYDVVTATGAATLKTLTTDYTVSGGGGSTGTVTMLSAPASGHTLVIVRNVPLTQESDFVQNDASDAEVVEDALDKLTMADQQLSARLDRSFTLADSDVSGASLAVPTPSANKLVGWNSAGTALENKTPADIDLATVTTFIETLLDDADAATARTTLGVPSSSEAILDTIIDAKGDLIYGAAADTPAVLANGIEMIGAAPGGRLTLTSGTPVTTGDVTGATTVYYTPHQGNIVSLYDGDTWIPYIFSELSQATSDTSKSPAAVANNSNYDIFVWNDSGTLRATRGPLWTSDTARGTGAGTTELELFEGRYVNKVDISNGPVARKGLYVGTIRSDGSAQINDSLAKRHVWNNYNRVSRPMRNATETADSWTYSTATIRQANANSANQLDCVIGVNEETVDVRVASSSSDSSANQEHQALIGLDSTSAMATGCIKSFGRSQVSGQIVGHFAFWNGLPGIGRHTITWLEYANTSGTGTWYGDAGSASRVQSGIEGTVRA